MKRKTDKEEKKVVPTTEEDEEEVSEELDLSEGSLDDVDDDDFEDGDFDEEDEDEEDDDDGAFEDGESEDDEQKDEIFKRISGLYAHYADKQQVPGGLQPASDDEDDEEDEDEDEDEDEEEREVKADKARRVASGSKASTRDPEAMAAAAKLAKARPHYGDHSDSDEDDHRNTIGNVPLEWYKHEDHIGYDREGKKLIKRERKDALDNLLDRNDGGKAMRTIYDEYNDEEITLTKEELKMIMRIREGRFPHMEVNPHAPYDDWYTREEEVMPLSAAPEPKRRFIPSKHEEKKIVKLVRALRNGWIKKKEEKKEDEEDEPYLIWAEDGVPSEKMAHGMSYIPPPKPKVPGHEESYNPPAEYVPTEEERQAYDLMAPEDKPAFIPRAYAALRNVPAYENFIRERFERCLDLYLCPRARRRRLDINPEDLVPKLPKPKDLEPFPKTLCIRYEGHKGRVNAVAPESSGQYLATCSEDGTVKLWEVQTGRCLRTWDFGVPIKRVAWCPASTHRLLSCTAGKAVHIFSAGVGTEEQEQAAAEALKAAAPSDQPPLEEQPSEVLSQWVPSDKVPGGLCVVHRFLVRYLAWHARGDYFTSVCPEGNTQSVLVHQLSKRATQNPFRKSKGRVVRALFHPSKPFFFLATQNAVRVYNLAKQELAKKLIGGSGAVTSMAVHPSGDHILIGSEDKRVCWYDLDLSTKPYKTLRYHTTALQAVTFHRSYPLFASAADDGTCQVFHGMVYQDLMTNPLLVPVKVLRGHDIVDYVGVTDCAFHPTQPWVFTCGADGAAILFCN